MERIVTPRLVLRPFELADVRPLHAFMSDPETMRYWSTPPHATVGETEAWVAATIAAVAGGDSSDQVITRDGVVIGKAGLWKGEEFGILLGRPAWGLGLAHEATLAVLRGARSAGRRRVTADVDPRNERSVRLLESAGFTRTGHALKTFCVRGEWSDSLYLEHRLEAL